MELTKLLVIVGAIVGSGLVLGIGIIIGHFGIKKNESTVDYKYSQLTRQVDEKNYKTFIDSINANNIEANLKDLTSRPHMAGLPEDLDSAVVIENRWKQDGLTVFKPRYNVLLSYPNETFVNRVILKDGIGNVIIQTNGTEKNYDSTQNKTVDPFLAYTPNGNVTSAKLYYANFGELEDLQNLEAVVGRENLQGSIIIMRYGRIFRGDKVMHAQRYGAIGAILYNDPQNYAPMGIEPSQTYDQTWFMPQTGAQRGSSYTSNGDPLTPFYPSTDYMTRSREEDVIFLPKIPAHPISYMEAQVILQNMGGIEVNQTWKGSLPGVTYRYGGVLADGKKIQIISNNRRERKNTYNVIGIMKGEIEPDRYVVIGNHRDAWSLGAVDPTSGTATLLEITRVLGEMYKNGFRPRRSLMFCSWGAEEYGLIGSVEYVQEYVKVLGARVISYLNLDIAVEGNYTIDVKASPMLFDAIVEAGKMVPSAYDVSGQTVYDKWMKVRQNTQTQEPKIEYGLGSGSDFLGFDQLVGSSNFDATYWFNPEDHGNLGSYPLYHTSYEVFSMMKKFVDPEFLAHQAMGRFTGMIALMLAESPVLPLNVTRYTTALRLIISQLTQSNPSIDFSILRSAVDDFESATKIFVDRSKSMDVNNPYEIRIYNDQLLQLERAFLNPLGQGGDDSDMKHVVYAPAKTNKYAASGFPSIGDALVTGDQEKIKYQIAIATYFVRGALATLKNFHDFINN